MRIVILAAFMLLVNSITAQTGWESIANNDFTQAAKSFQAELEKDSINKTALEGMIFLSEFHGNSLMESKYAETYIRNHYSDLRFYTLASKTGRGLNDFEHGDMSFRFQIPKLSDEAYEDKVARKFESYKSKYLKIYNPFKWSFMGPFQNINGYGYLKEFEPEHTKFDAKKTIVNFKKQEINWVQPAYIHPKHMIDFKRHLNVGYKDAVCFANSFFEIQEDQEVYVKVGRYSPIKIWVDDQLVFGEQNAIDFEFDTEQVKIKLKKGNHRILVKSALGTYYKGDKTASGYGNSYDLMRSFDSGIEVIQKMNKSSYNKSTIRIRLTDKAGLPIEMTSSYDNTAYAPGNFNPEKLKNNFINEIEEHIKNDDKNLFNYYLLLNAALAYGNEDEIEKRFHYLLKSNSESSFFKYLAAKVYMINGKREKGYEALDGIDVDKSPSYALLSEKLKEVDPVNSQEKFEKELEKLLKLAPTNLNLIKLKGKYLKENGKKDELETFIKNIQEEYPDYKETYALNRFLDDDLKPVDYDMSRDYSNVTTDKERFKAAKKRIAKEFKSYDYTILIKKYKGDDKPDKVLALYDELIGVEPYNDYHREKKAKYLFNLERYDESLAEMEEILKIKPYNQEIYELMGDIYFDQDKKAKALELYQKAILLSSKSYTISSIQEKIAKIEGVKKLKEKFTTASFEDWMTDRSWTKSAQKEESVIIGHSKDLIYDEQGKVHMYSKMLILILTEAGASSWVEYDFSRLGKIDYVKVIKSNGAELVPDANGSFAVFKNLEPGDLIQLEASADWRPKSELGNELIMFNYTTYHAPVYNFKMEVMIPEGKAFTYKMHKLEDSMVKSTKEGYDHYTWKFANIPKITREEAAIDGNDIWSNIQISTVENWGDIVNWYHAKTYRKLESKYEIDEILAEIITDTMTDEEKVITVYNYITEKIKYSFNNLLNSNFIPKNADLTCSGKIGDCKDVATVMINMLTQLGIESHFVLVKTNSYFDMETVPSMYFDHVIAGVKLNGEMKYYDLTTDNYPHYVINENDVNAWGLIIDGPDEKLFRLPNDYLNTDKNGIQYDIVAQINNDYSIDIEVDAEYKGLLSGLLREWIEAKPKHEVENKLLEMIGEELFNNVKLEQMDFENPDNITEPLRGKYKLKSDKYSDNVLDIYFMNVPFLNPVNNSVVFSSEERMNTLDLSLITEVAPTKESLLLRFPEGKRLYKLPEDISIDNEYFSYQLKFTKEKDAVKVVKYQKFKKQHVTVDEFNIIKDVYTKLYDADKTKIVLVNKKGSILN